MSPSKSVPALPSSDVPAQKPSELAEPPSQTVTREGNVPFQQRSYRAGRVKQVPVKFKNETEPTPPDRIFKLASRDNCLHLLFDIFPSPSPSLYIRSTLILCFSFLFFFLIQKGDVIVCSEGPPYFVRTQCCVTVQTILTLVRTLPYKGIQVKSGAFTCFLMAQAY